MHTRFLFIITALASSLLISSCVNSSRPKVITKKRSSPAALFENVAHRAGLDFTHSNGASGRYYFIEDTPAGCALFDFNRDGYLDVFLVQSDYSAKTSANGKTRAHCGLYRNKGNGSFLNVTAGSGFDRDLGYAHGVAIGDYDNDGFEDLFLTSYQGNHLFHNEKGTGIFKDVTAAIGLGKKHSTGYATSAAFGDYDNDGRLDLYVCYYCPWTWKTDKPCSDTRGLPDYCAPQLYDPDTHRLYHNEKSRFVDVSDRAGITRKKGRGLAVAFIDYNNDGRQDIYVVNDLTPHLLWQNNGNGTFTDQAIEAGIAFSEGGNVMAGMGIAIGDHDHSGLESLFVTNFSGLPNTLFQNTGRGLFRDAGMISGLALPHMKFLAFGCEFIDYDADTWRDLLVANGHVQVHAETQMDGVTYKERKQLFRNNGNGRFTEIVDARKLGPLSRPMVSRGLAVGDFDNDGRLDALVSNQNDPVQLFRNRDTSNHHWVSFRTVGTKSNRDGVHARITIRAGRTRQFATVRGGSSYLSQSDRRVYFGLGAANRIDEVRIQWPSGVHDVLRNVKADTSYTITEGRGLAARS